jgi:HlyD family secretion protein
MNSPSPFVLVFAFGLLAGCEQAETEVVALGTLESDRIELVADSSEPIIDVHVKEGDRVDIGDPLLAQDPSRVNVMMSKAKADLAVARAKLAEAEAGPRAQNIAAARAQVAAADSEMKTAKIELERERSLVAQNYASQNNVDILEGRYESTTARKEEAEAVLAELIEGTRSEEIDAVRSNFAMAQSQVDDIQLSLDRTVIRAPVAGKVEAVIFEEGERPQPGIVVVVLVRNQTPYARVHVPEPLRTRLAPGAPAEVTIDGHEQPFEGRLRWIAHDASFTPFFALTQHDRSHLSYVAEVELIDGAAEIATGVPVQVRFPE